MAKRVYKNLQQIEHDMQNATKEAIERTLDELEKKLNDLIDAKIYNAYQPKFYTYRTYWIKQKGVIRQRLYSAGNKGYSGQIIIDTTYNYPYYPPLFVHGNRLEPFNSIDFLEMLNGEIPQGNAFGFKHIDRGHFWTDFVNYCNENYTRIFNRHFKDITGINLNPIFEKPKAKASANKPTASTNINKSNNSYIPRKNAYSDWSDVSDSNAWSSINDLNSIFNL